MEWRRGDKRRTDEESREERRREKRDEIIKRGGREDIGEIDEKREGRE